MLNYAKDIIVRFEDADPAGVIFYPRALALAHSVVEEMIRQSGPGWHAWFASPVNAAPVRRAEVDFLLPMRAGEAFTARAAVAKLGASSVEFVVTFSDARGRTAAKISTVHVFIDKATRKPTPLTPAIRQALKGKGSNQEG